MSKNINFKLEVDEILTKSQKKLLERIETLRTQIKEIRERELSKSLIPVHDHRPSSTVGPGAEDVPYGKLNPKGVDKSVKKNAQMGYGNPPPTPNGSGMGQGMGGLAMSQKPVVKAEMCKKCGSMHMPLDKCGGHTMVVGAKKAELQDEKGHRESNSVKSPHPTPKKQGGDEGGIVLPGAKLKKALTAGVASGPPSTKVNDLGKAAPAPAPKPKSPSVAMAGNMKQNPKNTFPTKGSDGGAAKPKVMHVQPDAEHKSELEKAIPRSLAAAGMLAAGVAGTLGGVHATKQIAGKYAQAQQDKLTADTLAAQRPSSGIKLPGHNLKNYSQLLHPGGDPQMSQQGDNLIADGSAGTNVDVIHDGKKVHGFAGPAKGTPALKAEPNPAAQKAKNRKEGLNAHGQPKDLNAQPDLNEYLDREYEAEKKPAQKAEPPMAKPPSGVNMSTKVPTSTSKPVTKSMVGDMKGAGNTGLTSPSNMGRANTAQAALAGEFQPKGPISSGLELARPAKAGSPAGMRASGSLGLASPKPALGLASPKAAGALPGVGAKPAAPQAQAPAAKPGIFGKIGGFRKP